jgi:hypothetical protein
MTRETLPAEELQRQKAAARDKKRFVKVTFDGSSCICEPQEVGDMADGCDGAVLTDVWMTEAEWEALPEFTGW